MAGKSARVRRGGAAARGSKAVYDLGRAVGWAVEALEQRVMLAVTPHLVTWN